MALNLENDTDTSLRGPLLAAHRALRKAINARCAELKGECSAVAWERRQAGQAAPLGEELLRPLIFSQALSSALAHFGGPGLIPQHAGFVAYVCGQQQKVTVARALAASDCNIVQAAQAAAEADAAASAVSRTSAVKAQVAVEAWGDFTLLFEKTFEHLLALVGKPTE